MTSPMNAPLPSVELANRVGQSVGNDGSYELYEAIGAGLHAVICGALPPDWDWTGKRVLDFGSGSGRVLRHFLDEAQTGHFEACDIDAEAIDWLNANLNPPITGFVNQALPPLPREDESYDLIYAVSVFTHLTDSWADWLLELHRVLAPGGWLVATFLSAGFYRTYTGEDWNPDLVGLNVLNAYQDWDHGGPTVFMSPWWIREHWGRAFDIAQIVEGGTGQKTQDLIVARARPGDFTASDLLAVNAEDQREIQALRHNLAQVQREAAALAATVADLSATNAELQQSAHNHQLG